MMIVDHGPQIRQAAANLQNPIGPIVDAHDIQLVILPGGIVIVAALICLSFSTGLLLSHKQYEEPPG